MAERGVTAVDVRPAALRFRTRTDWLDSRHSFSFGPHYDPTNTHFGLLLAHNDDVVRAGAGFARHPHRDVEIITWVLEGALAHEDSTGRSGVVHPGLVQRVSAGTGIRHAERNAGAQDVRFVQIWVQPDEDGTPPGYAQCDVSSPLAAGEAVVVASGMPRHADDRAVPIGQEQAALHAVRLPPGAATALPVAPLAHVFLARGAAALEGAGSLERGDAARVTGADGQRLTAGPAGAEVLTWEMHATLGGASPGQPSG